MRYAKQYKHIYLSTWIFCLFVFLSIVFNTGGYNKVCNLTFIIFSVFSLITILGNRVSFKIEEIILLIFAIEVFIMAGIGGFSISGIKQSYSVGGLTALIILAVKSIEKERIRVVENSYIIGSFVLALWSLYTWINGKETRLGDDMTANSINVGIVLAFNAVFLMERLLVKNFKIGSILYIVDIVLLIFTQARGPIIIGLGGSLLLFLLEKDKKEKKRKIKRIKLVFAMLVGIAIFIGFKEGFYDEYLSRFKEFVYVVQHGSDELSSTSVRLYLKKQGLAGFLKKPFIGHGIGSTKLFLDGSYFHDNLIEIAYEMGITGVFTYYISFVAALYHGIKSKNMLASVILLFILADGVFDVTYHTKIFYILYAICLINIYGSDKKGGDTYSHVKDTSCYSFRSEICGRRG